MPTTPYESTNKYFSVKATYKVRRHCFLRFYDQINKRNNFRQKINQKKFLDSYGLKYCSAS